jgi:pyridoxamine 5'-phosphate oxidase
MPAIDPIQQYVASATRAQQHGLDTAPATLATATAAAVPSARVVLLRHVDARGFVFYTNYGSRKARDLAENPRAALCQHWAPLDEQIRVEGTVVRLEAGESDVYFRERPRESQLGAWASEQSATLESRDLLERRYREVEQRFTGQTVPRPPFWGGFRLVPEQIEFWYGRPGRLHDRLLFVRDGQFWTTTRLYP